MVSKRLEEELSFLEEELQKYKVEKASMSEHLANLQITIERHVGSIVTIKKLIGENKDGAE